MFKRSGLRAERGEKQLEWTRLDQPGLTASATNKRLVVLRDGDQTWQRHWHEIASAGWDRDEYELTVRPVTGEPITLRVPDGGNLNWPTTVRERIQASVVTWRTASVPGTGEIRVAVRQRHDGSLVVQSSFPPGHTIDSPGARAAFESLRKALSEDMGSPGL